MKVTKYIPVWHVTFNGKTYSPASPGQSPKTIEGLPEDEIKRLLKMGAIKKLEFSEPDPGELEFSEPDTNTDPDGQEPDTDTDPGDKEPDSKPAVFTEMSYNELRSYAAAANINVGANPNKEELIRILTEAQENVS